jgi:hypothetical protein
MTVIITPHIVGINTAAKVLKVTRTDLMRWEGRGYISCHRGYPVWQFDINLLREEKRKMKEATIGSATQSTITPDDRIARLEKMLLALSEKLGV